MNNPYGQRLRRRRAPCRGRASRRSTRAPACRWPGTRAATRAASAPRRCSPPPTGLYVGMDTDYIGNRAVPARPGLAFFPLAGGAAAGVRDHRRLPGAGLPRRPLPRRRRGRHRHRALPGQRRRRQLPPLDAGPDWAADDAPVPHRTGSNAAGWDSDRTHRDASGAGDHPAGGLRHRAVGAERRPGDEWDFPVPPGRPSRCGCTSPTGTTCTQTPGQRVFDVSIDGAPVLDDYDIVADVGHAVGHDEVVHDHQRRQRRHRLRPRGREPAGQRDRDRRGRRRRRRAGRQRRHRRPLVRRRRPPAARSPSTAAGSSGARCAARSWPAARSSTATRTPAAVYSLYRRTFDGTTFGDGRPRWTRTTIPAGATCTPGPGRPTAARGRPSTASSRS